MSIYKHNLSMAVILSLTIIQPQESIAKPQSGVLGANEKDDQFTRAMATGDFDGDGIMDLAIGAPGESPGRDPKSGIIFVYQGTDGVGLQHWQAHTQSSIQSNGYSLGYNEDGDKFGYSLTSGDFDRDGFDDLAVGAPGEAPGSHQKSGVVFLFKGSADGLTAWKSIDQTNTAANGYSIGLNEDDDRFGFSLTSGDFNADGFDDLAIGAPGEAPGEDPKSGAVFLFNGSLTGLTAFGSLTQRGLDSNTQGDQFGFSLASGDFNGDDFDDLAIGAPYKGSGAEGNVYTFKGSAIEMKPWETLEPRRHEVKSKLFGFSLAAGKILDDHDKTTENLVVGSPYSTARWPYNSSSRYTSGSVVVFAYKHRSNPKERLLYPYPVLSLGLQAKKGDYFGWSVLIYDNEIVIGVPGKPTIDNLDSKTGAVFFSKQFITDQVEDRNAITPLRKVTKNGRFGHSLAAGNFSGGDDQQLVVGAPDIGFEGRQTSGWAFVYKDNNYSESLPPYLHTYSPLYSFGQ
jgi:hypothetical protein